MEVALPGRPEGKRGHCAATKLLRLHGILGNEQACASGSYDGLSLLSLGCCFHELFNQRLLSLQRPSMDELSEADLPQSLAVKGKRNYAMHTDSAITLRFQSAITGVEPVMANRWAEFPEYET